MKTPFTLRSGNKPSIAKLSGVSALKEKTQEQMLIESAGDMYKSEKEADKKGGITEAMIEAMAEQMKNKEEKNKKEKIKKKKIKNNNGI